MKRLAIAFLCLLFIGAAVAWCFLRDNDKARNVLPKDVTAVAVFEPADFFEDLGFNPSKAGKLVQNLEDVVEGIDLSKPAYAFASESGLSGIALNVHDVEKLLKAFSFFGYASEEQEGFQWVVNKSSIGCIDKDKLLLCGHVSATGQDALRSEMVKLMSQSKQDVPVIEKVLQQEGVLRLSTSFCNLPKEYARSFPADADLSKAFLDAALRIDEKAIALSTKVEGVENLSLPLSPIKGTLATMQSEKPFFWLCANMKGEELLPHLRKVPELRSALLALNMCVDADLMIKAIDGDVMLAVPKADFKHPDFLFAATLANTDFLANSDDWQVGRRNKTDFFIRQEGVEVFFGVREGRLYIASNTGLADKTFLDAEDNDFQKAAKGKYLSASLDVGQIIEIYPAVAIMLKALPQVREITDAFECITLTSDSPQGMELSIQTNKPVKEIVQNLWSLMTGDKK